MPRLVTAASVLLCLAAAAVGAQTDVQSRTVFISALDKSGNPITDLHPNELVVKVDGKVAVIAAAGPAAERMRLAIVVNNPSQTVPSLRAGLSDFVTALNGKAEIAIFTTLQPSATVVNFTPDASVVTAAIRDLLPNLPLEPRDRTLSYPGGGIVGMSPTGMTAREIVKALLRHFEMEAVARPVIVLVERPSSAPADLGCLRTSALENGGCNAARYPRDDTSKDYFHPPAYLAPMYYDAVVGSDLQPMLARARTTLFAIGGPSEPSRSSGGYAEGALTDDQIAPAMKRVAVDLTSQYAVTFRVGSAPKDDANLRIESTRPGVKIRAPERVW